MNLIKSEITLVKVISTKATDKAKIMAYCGLIGVISRIREERLITVER